MKTTNERAPTMNGQNIAHERGPEKWLIYILTAHFLSLFIHSGQGNQIMWEVASSEMNERTNELELANATHIRLSS